MNLTDFANIESLGPAALLAIALVFIWRAWMADRGALLATHEKVHQLVAAMIKSDEGMQALLRELLAEVRRSGK